MYLKAGRKRKHYSRLYWPSRNRCNRIVDKLRYTHDELGLAGCVMFWKDKKGRHVGRVVLNEVCQIRNTATGGSRLLWGHIVQISCDITEASKWSRRLMVYFNNENIKWNTLEHSGRRQCNVRVWRARTDSWSHHQLSTTYTTIRSWPLQSWAIDQSLAPTDRVENMIRWYKKEEVEYQNVCT